jgi:hypothetical protein
MRVFRTGLVVVGILLIALACEVRANPNSILICDNNVVAQTLEVTENIRVCHMDKCVEMRWVRATFTPQEYAYVFRKDNIEFMYRMFNIDKKTANYKLVIDGPEGPTGLQGSCVLENSTKS